MTDGVFLESGTWPGSPMKCTATGKLAWTSREKALAWYRSNAPRCPIERIFTCDICAMIHIDAHAPDPSGGSSGNTRTAKHRHDEL